MFVVSIKRGLITCMHLREVVVGAKGNLMFEEWKYARNDEKLDQSILETVFASVCREYRTVIVLLLPQTCNVAAVF